MSRKVARENVFKLVFEFVFNGAPNDKTYELLTVGDLDETDREYIDKVYRGIVSKYKELAAIILKYSNGFALERIYKPDLAVMLVAIYEMKYMDDIPNAVSINEAIDIVKRYSTDRSNIFVNGILSSVNKMLEE